MQLCPQLANDSTQYSRGEFLATIAILPCFAHKSKLQRSRKQNKKISVALGDMDGCADLFNLSGFARAEDTTRIFPVSPRHKREVEQNSSVVVALAALVCMCVLGGKKVGKMSV